MTDLTHYVTKPLTQGQRYILRELVDHGFLWHQRYIFDCRKDGHDADGGLNWPANVFRVQVMRIRAKLKPEFSITSWAKEGYRFHSAYGEERKALSASHGSIAVPVHTEGI